MALARSIVGSEMLRALLVQPLWLARFITAAVRSRSVAFLRFYPGYHGSTIPSAEYVRSHRERLFDRRSGDADGIDLRVQHQLALLDRFAAYYLEFAPAENEVTGRLYYYNNPMFGFPDAFTLYSVLREFAPKRVIEVGSGHSSALMLDTAREHLPDTHFTFIDPYSTTIERVVADAPAGNFEFVKREVQDVDLDIFRRLDAGDVLFIDTSHSVKIGSDLSTIIFSILPALQPGVLVHIHDIYIPWEYPEEMVMEGRTYNEVYFVRAFLQFNKAFEILYSNALMEREHRAVIDERMPGYFKPIGQKGGQSLWLRKVA